MSSSEDYLDSLLNSINKAKSDATTIEQEAKERQEKSIQNRMAIAPEDDFFAATGINEKDLQTASSHPYLRKAFSEEDFLKEFEEKLLNDDNDSFVEAFEMEIDEEERVFQETGQIPDSQNVVDSLLNGISNAVSSATKATEDEPAVEEDEAPNIESSEAESSDAMDAFPSLDDDTFVDTIDESELEDLDDLNVDAPVEDDPLDIDSEDFSLEGAESDEGPESESEEAAENIMSGLDSILDDFNIMEGEEDTSMSEFAPDEMDALDAEEFGDEPDLSGDGGIDLDNLLGDDDELSDLKSMLDGDDLGDIDEDAEGDSSDGDGKGKKKGKEKKAKGKKEKVPNPKVEALKKKFLTLIFGPIDEEEIAQEKLDDQVKKINKKRKKDPNSLNDEEKSILEKVGQPVTPEEIQAFEEKKKAAEAKKEKPPKEEKPKKEKPAKPAKAKKPKKEKEPDNSPKIPISIIVTFLVLSISIIGAVLVLMNYMGVQRHMAQANELYDAGNYIAAYEKLNGLDLKDEDDILTRNRSRCLADLQQCEDEYKVFIDQELYDFALDSLIKGVGRYEKFKDEATEYGIAEQYDGYNEFFVAELSKEFQLSKEEALFIFNQTNRHYYTIELRKVLIRLGLEE